MSKVAELAYDIEQLFIEGYSPKSIAVQLGCPVDIVYDWMESQSLSECEEDAEDYEDPGSYLDLL